jgi:signal transduction histidine kinase
MSGVEVSLKCDLGWESGTVETRLPAQLEDTVYRLVQEALANIVKHAGPATAAVAVLESDAAVEVLVSDTGSGFDPAVVSTGFGLLGMHERVGLAGGSLEIESAPTAGTTIRAVLPGGRAREQQLAVGT